MAMGNEFRNEFHRRLVICEIKEGKAISYKVIKKWNSDIKCNNTPIDI